MGKNKSFRSLDKERFTILIPPKLARLIRKEALENRESLSHTGCVLMARGLGVDAASAGISKSRVAV